MLSPYYFHLSEFEINNSNWDCNKCMIIKTATIFPFGLEEDMDIENIMNTDSIKALDNLPSYEITSKAISFDALKGNGLDENFIYIITMHMNLKLWNLRTLSIFSILT